MSRREEILAEMGLAPVWKLRGREEKVFETQVSIQEKENPTGNLSSWIELKQAVPACTACGLHKGRTQTVFGVGDEDADWLLVGEAPGAEEDRLGEPFVGQAGRLLDNMLAAIDLRRGENVYIANVLKCRPPGNRNPEPEEVAKCTPHLLRQIELIRPKLIVAMGRFAAQTLLSTDATIASLRGRLHRYAGVPLVVTYHPAYLLRNLPDKSKAWADLVFARKTMLELNREQEKN
jgi:uracil-DNA glycosylase